MTEKKILSINNKIHINYFYTISDDTSSCERFVKGLTKYPVTGDENTWYKIISEEFDRFFTSPYTGSFFLLFFNFAKKVSNILYFHLRLL